MTGNDLITLLMLGAATSAASVTVTRSFFFRRFRLWVDKKSAVLGDLVHCHWCMGHWFAALILWLFLVDSGDSVSWVNALVSWLAVTTFSGVFAALITMGMSSHAGPAK